MGTLGSVLAVGMADSLLPVPCDLVTLLIEGAVTGLTRQAVAAIKVFSWLCCRNYSWARRGLPRCSIK